MLNVSRKNLYLLPLLGALTTAPAYADNAASSPNTQPVEVTGPSLSDALFKGTPWLEMRYRFEDVSQNGLKNKEGQANTLRTVVGYDTGVYKDFKISLAGLNVSQFGYHDYNDGSDGKKTYPSIGDPADTQLFLANATYTGLPQTTAVVGRQKIDLDNQRFVGSANWRQIPTAFDGVTVANKSLQDTELYYGFVFHENRSPGTGVTNGTYDMHTHLLHVAYTGIKDLRIVGYNYLMDIKNIPTSSNATTGFRLEEKHDLEGGFGLLGNGEYAYQTDYADNPHKYALNYYLLEPGASYDAFTTKLGYEVLQGNGVDAVQTPMMAPHPQNGWADQFSTTPAGGLHDTWVKAVYKFHLPFEDAGDSRLEGQWHSYNADYTAMHYGNEYDLDFTQQIAKHYSLGLQLEDYLADRLLTNTRKIIFTGQLNF